jgi:short-subunit dehydrogenase
MKYTLITGASRGIGLAMAEYCASKGFNLILVARSCEKLTEISERLAKQYKVDVKCIETNLTDESSVQDMLYFCNSQNLNIDKLINNAGAGLYGRFVEIDLQKQLELMALNQSALVKMTYNFIPLLKNNSKAFLLNVSSTACYQPIPYMSIYAATQSFIQSFTLGLREELKNSHIQVSVLCPGPTATEFFERAGLNCLPVNSREIKMSPSDVAKVAIEGLMNGISEIIPGTNNTLGAYFSKLMPNKWIVKTVNSLFAPATV